MKTYLAGFVATLLLMMSAFAPSIARSEAQTLNLSHSAVVAMPTPPWNDDAEPPLAKVDETYIDAWYRPAKVRRLWRNEVFFISLYSTPTDDETITRAGVMTNIFDDIDRDFAAAENLIIDGDRISFRTKSVGRVSYRFAGVFFKHRKMGETGERVLRGTLTRYVSGKRAGRYRGDFIFIEPICLR